MQTDKHTNISIVSIIRSPFVFIGILALVSALILSTISEASREKVKENEELDIMKNVLLCRYLHTTGVRFVYLSVLYFTYVIN